MGGGFSICRSWWLGESGWVRFVAGDGVVEGADELDMRE